MRTIEIRFDSLGFYQPGTDTEDMAAAAFKEMLDAPLPRAIVILAVFKKHGADWMEHLAEHDECHMGDECDLCWLERIERV